MMKKLATLILLALCASAVADNIKTTLRTATVYFSGAELTHTANVTLKQGENEITLEGLTPNININSLRINVNNSVMLTSSEFTNDYLTEKKQSDLVQLLRDSLNFCNDEVTRLTTAININRTSLALLKTGIETNLGGSVSANATANTNVARRGLSVAELTQNLDFFNTKSTALERSIAADTRKKEELGSVIARLQNQIRQEQSNRGVYNGLLRLNLLASYATNATVTVTYFTSQASWTPFYDMIINDIARPVQLRGRSRVRQTTGIDWNRVNITLSTATPAQTREAPLFSAWFLNFVNPVARVSQPTGGLARQNRISYDMAEERLEEMEVVAVGMGSSQRLLRTGSSPAQNTQPLYIVDGVVFDGDINQLDPNSILSTEVLRDASATAIYGSRAANGVIIITTKQMEDFITAEERQISMEYKIDLPYSIPGNGKEQIIDLQNHELSADYKFYSAPKLDPSVFLIADFRDWERLNLLSGMANVTYDGTFVGQTFLNTAQTNQTLSVTLGTENRISVRREQLRDFSQVRSSGSENRVTLAYKITVRNNQNRPVKFTLKDQYPISAQRDIRVELHERETTTPTFNNEETGVLTWDFDLAAGESREFRISYTVRYPKDRRINLR